MAICGYVGILIAVCFMGIVAVLVGALAGRLSWSKVVGAVTAFALGAGLNAGLFVALYRSTPPNVPPEVTLQSLFWCVAVGSVLSIGCGTVASVVAAVVSKAPGARPSRCE